MTLLLERPDRDPRLCAIGAEFWLDGDPLQPSLVLIFKQSRYDYPSEARQRAATGFTREYRRLLRLWSADSARGAAGWPRPLGERDSATTLEPPTSWAGDADHAPPSTDATGTSGWRRPTGAS